MVKKASDLQERIIRLAYKKGLRSFEGKRSGLQKGKHTGHILWQLEAVKKFFNLREGGTNEGTARAAVNSASKKMELRGLAERIDNGTGTVAWRTGLMLTEEGIDKAKEFINN